MLCKTQESNVKVSRVGKVGVDDKAFDQDLSSAEGVSEIVGAGKYLDRRQLEVNVALGDGVPETVGCGQDPSRGDDAAAAEMFEDRRVNQLFLLQRYMPWEGAVDVIL